MSPTTANEEFLDLMPHRIKVEGTASSYDDYGQPVDVPAVRVYACLIDDNTTVVKRATGNEVTSSLTAFVAPVPIDPPGSTDPVDISDDDKVEILSPRPAKRPVVAIERHYDAEDGEGMLHNIVLRFS